MEKEVMNFIKEEEDFWKFAKECWEHGACDDIVSYEPIVFEEDKN